MGVRRRNQQDDTWVLIDPFGIDPFVSIPLASRRWNVATQPKERRTQNE